MTKLLKKTKPKSKKKPVTFLMDKEKLFKIWAYETKGSWESAG